LAELELIDEIVEEIMKAREITLPKICIKALFLTYWAYAVNTYDIKYYNRQLNRIIRPNVGCLILCEKGTGKSLTVSLLRDLFLTVETERKNRYERIKELKIGIYERSAIPSAENKKMMEDFYATHGRGCVSIHRNVSTAKSLCLTYSQTKNCNTNNILFNIDEMGGVIEDVCSKTPSISGKEFWQLLNELFDGNCTMGASVTSKNESIESQFDVGANFIFTSTAEFLKDYHVQKKYQQSIQAGLARRLFFINCPPIDLWNADMRMHSYNITKFKPMIDEILSEIPRGKMFSFNNELKEILELPASNPRKGVVIFDEYFIMLYCTVLAVWTGSDFIELRHWEYVLSIFNEIKALSMDVVKDDTTSYDRICTFMREYLEAKSKKKVPLVMIKDFCVRSKLCFDSKFKKWFDGLCNDFVSANTSKYIIERNQMYAWLSDNFAFSEGG